MNSLRPHGGVRGLSVPRSSTMFDGPFGRMFRALPPADFGKSDAESLANLTKLASAMLAAFDPPKDGPDPEESGIPAAYTYFAQFVDHDLTFDPSSSLQKQNDPEALVDFRTPQFDMDNLYGRGPDDQPYLYDGNNKFVLGRKLNAVGANHAPYDLQRNQQHPPRALIGDPRNDENVIVSQFQGLWQRFHNKLVQSDPTAAFSEIQRQVRFHYQWMLLHDFLPTLVSSAVLDAVMPTVDGRLIIDKGNLKFFRYRETAFMPLEFSAAAYRFGHSMVRPGYRLNDDVGPLAIFSSKNQSPPAKRSDLRGFEEMPTDWAIDWNRFIDLTPLPYGSLEKPNDPGNKNRLQLAYRMDTSLVNPLGDLPRSVGFDPAMLALRNLERGWRMRLPAGQEVARAMGVVPLKDSDIKIGKFTSDPKDIDAQRSIADINLAFTGNCPLWTYVLAETVKEPRVVDTKPKKTIDTFVLGPVGGRIVAETFLGLLLADSNSYVSQDPLWMPPSIKKGTQAKFGLREFMEFVL